MDILAIVISVLTSVVSGTALFFLKRYFDKRDKREENEGKRRHEKDKLLFKSIKAIGDLAAANTIALANGKSNGETMRAMEDKKIIDKEVYDFLISNE